MHIDTKYVSIILEPIRVPASYRPKFGLSKSGLELKEFAKLYGADPFYSWIGLDSPLIYAAHKAAGGMTSIYRLLGMGCERLFRALLQDTLHLTETQSKWAYEIAGSDGRPRTLRPGQSSGVISKLNSYGLRCRK